MSAATAVVVSAYGDTMPLDYIVAAWLHAKTTLSYSPRTNRAYRETIASFRTYLRRYSLDLDASDERAIADAAQVWAGLRWEEVEGVPPAAAVVAQDPTDEASPAAGEASKPPQPVVSANTYNQRLAILSSFYVYARKRRHLRPGATNPLEMVERRPAKRYAQARPLEAAVVERCLSAIDRSTLTGLRDYALLLAALSTGRRRFELAGLRARNVEIIGLPGEEVVTLTYARTKGDRSHPRDRLEPLVTRALLVYLRAIYPDGWDDVAPDAPIWLAFTPRLRGKRHALAPAAIRDICLKRLGSGKVHATRHTFAVQMVKVGAPVTLIRDKLGHSSLATTTEYLATLTSDENAYVGQLVASYGVH